MATLLKVEGLKKFFEVRKSMFSKPIYVKAVNDVSFEIEKGSIFAVVGESGSGKSTLGRTVIKLIEPTAGKIFYDGHDITQVEKRIFSISGAECRSSSKTPTILCIPENSSKTSLVKV